MSFPLDTIQSIKNQRYFKISFIFVLSIFLSFFFWFFLKTNFYLVFLTTSGISNLLLSLVTLLVFCLFFALFALGIYLLKDFRLISLFILLTILPFFLVFGFSLFSIIGFVLLGLALYFWAKRIIWYDDRHAPFNPLLCTRIGLRSAIIVFLFVVSFSFYFYTIRQGQMDYFIPRLENYAISLTHQGLKFVLPGYNKDMDIDAFSNLVIENKIWRSFVLDQTERFSDNEAIQALKRAVEEKTGFEAENKKARDLVKFLIDDYVANVLLKYKELFSGAAALAFFLFLRLFTLVYYFLIRLFSWLWLKSLLGLGIVKKTKETVEVEKIAL